MGVFTADQVKSINAYQAAGVMHPFTCFGAVGDARCGATLTATEDGLVCPWSCGYRQDWAHEFMKNWQWAGMAFMTDTHRKRVEHGLASVGMTLADLEGK